jgi:hypothetical protein
MDPRKLLTSSWSCSTLLAGATAASGFCHEVLEDEVGRLEQELKASLNLIVLQCFCTSVWYAP